MVCFTAVELGEVAVSVARSAYGGASRALSCVRPMALAAITTAHSTGCRADLWGMLLATATAGSLVWGRGSLSARFHHASSSLAFFVVGHSGDRSWGPQSRSDRLCSLVCSALRHSILKCAGVIHRDEFLYQFLILDTHEDPVLDPCLLACAVVGLAQVHLLQQALQPNIEV